MNKQTCRHNLPWDTDDDLSDEKEIFSGAVRDEEEVLLANIDTDSDCNNGEANDDSNAQPKSSIQASSGCLLGRDSIPWKCFNPVRSWRAGAHSVFTAKPGVPRNVASSRSLYDVETFHF